MAKKSFYKIEMLFLKILEKEDCYGYQLTQSIQDITNGQIKIALIGRLKLGNAKPEFAIIWNPLEKNIFLN